MPYSPLGFFTGFVIANFNDLKGSQAAKVAVIPGILGLNIASLLLAKVVADQEAESLPPPVPQNPTIAVDPTSHDYKDVNVGSSVCKIFVVSNTGTADLVVTATTLSGDNSDEFAVVSGESVSGSPVTVTPGKTLFVEVSFKPASPAATGRSPKSASLDIVSNDPDQSTVTIDLSGTGVNGGQRD